MFLAILDLPDLHSTSCAYPLVYRSCSPTCYYFALRKFIFTLPSKEQALQILHWHSGFLSLPSTTFALLKCQQSSRSTQQDFAFNSDMQVSGAGVDGTNPLSLPKRICLDESMSGVQRSLLPTFPVRAYLLPSSGCRKELGFRANSDTQFSSFQPTGKSFWGREDFQVANTRLLSNLYLDNIQFPDPTSVCGWQEASSKATK